MLELLNYEMLHILVLALFIFCISGLEGLPKWTQAFKQLETFLQLLDVAAAACKSWLHVKMVKTSKWLHVNGELVTLQEAGACKLCSV